jgi:hypothetical protein
MDLDEATYRAVTQMPLAREVVEESRIDLVRRLDDYCISHHETFLEVHLLPPCVRSPRWLAAA